MPKFNHLSLTRLTISCWILPLAGLVMFTPQVESKESDLGSSDLGSLTASKIPSHSDLTYDPASSYSTSIRNVGFTILNSTSSTSASSTNDSNASFSSSKISASLASKNNASSKKSTKVIFSSAKGKTSSQVVLENSASKASKNKSLDLYPELNYTYRNTFTAQSYERLKSQEIEQYFKSFMPLSNGKSYNYQNTPLTIYSDKVEVLAKEGKIIYQGEVILQQGDRVVKADLLQYQRLADGRQVISFLAEGKEDKNGRGEASTGKASIEKDNSGKTNVGKSPAEKELQKEDKKLLSHLPNRDKEVTFSSNQIILSANTLVFNVNSRNLLTKDVDFALVDTIIHGKAKSIDAKKDSFILKNTSVYAGPVSPLTLNIASKHTEYSAAEKKITFTNPVFKIGKLPILYLSSYKIRTGSREQNNLGFSTPLLALNNSMGLLVSLPFNWRYQERLSGVLYSSYSTKKGLFFTSKTNIHSPLGYSLIESRFFPDYQSEKKQFLNRYDLHFKHDRYFNNGLVLNIDLNHQSDSNFLSDYFNHPSQFLPSSFVLSYQKKNYEFSLRSYHFAPINGNHRFTYETKPEINFLYHQDFSYFKPYFTTEGQYAYLVNPSAQFQATHRFYLVPRLNYSVINTYFKNTTSLGSYFLHYRQRDKYNQEEALTFVLPEFKTRFESSINYREKVLEKYNLQSTLGLGYYYRTNLGKEEERYVYDSGLLNTSTFTIEENTSTIGGIDRVGNANQLSLSLNLKALEDSGKEKIDLTMGYLHAFPDFNLPDFYAKSKSFLSNKKRKGRGGKGGLTLSTPEFSGAEEKGLITLYSSSEEQSNQGFERSKDLYLNGAFNFFDNYNFNFTSTLDLTRANSSMSIVSLNYQPSLTKIVQLSYRYISKNFIRDNLVGTNPLSLKQVGISSIWDLNPNTSFLASAFYDLKTQEAVDYNLALRYVYFGWSLGMRYERVRTSLHKFENKFNFEVQFFGFNNDYNNDFGRYINSGHIHFVGNR